MAGEAAILLAAQPFADNAQIRTTIVNSGAALDALNPNYMGKLGNVRVDFLTALNRLSLLPAISTYDNKNTKSYYVGGPDGDNPTADLRTLNEEYSLEIESGITHWWQAEFANTVAGVSNPSKVYVNAHYRSEIGWTGTLTAQYFNGASLVATKTLSVDSSEDPTVGKGRKGILRWDISSLVQTHSAVNAGRVRFINQSYNGKKVWVVYADLEVR